MSNYHFTPEQAWKVAEDLDYINSHESGLSGTVLMSKLELQAFANAVLDKVLGEPVGEFNEASSEESFGSVSWLLCNREPLKTGDKLYVPKELP